MHGVEPGSAVDATAYSVRNIYRDIAGTLRRAGVPSPELDARLLICKACGMSHETFVSEPTYRICEAERNRLDTLVGRRLRREPISRILSQREFWSLPFLIREATLDPRPDTELIVEAVLEITCKRETSEACLKLLDLGTGSGCILVSLLTELRSATGVGTDRSEEALRTALQNTIALGVADRASFTVMDWVKGLSGHFDIVVCNPPYIRREALAHLTPEVAIYDPEQALDGGDDGLAAYRAIIPHLRDVIAPEGCVVFEVGESQAGDVLAIMRANGIGSVPDSPDVHYDLAGHARVVLGQLCN